MVSRISHKQSRCERSTHHTSAIPTSMTPVILSRRVIDLSPTTDTLTRTILVRRAPSLFFTISSFPSSPQPFLLRLTPRFLTFPRTDNDFQLERKAVLLHRQTVLAHVHAHARAQTLVKKESRAFFFFFLALQQVVKQHARQSVFIRPP